jgi:hypothetical protein
MQNLSINVPLTELELNALVTMAQVSCRAPREQLRYLLRRQAQRRGLLETSPTQQKNPSTTQSWPADAVNGRDNRSHLETNSHAKDTTPA